MQHLEKRGSPRPQPCHAHHLRTSPEAPYLRKTQVITNEPVCGGIFVGSGGFFKEKKHPGGKRTKMLTLNTGNLEGKKLWYF